MRYGIFSDVHSNLEALEAVIEAYKSEAIDKYFCIGDSVGYGANPNECVAKIKAITAVAVAGNHDQASINLYPADNLNSFARQAVLWTADYINEETRYFLEGLKLTFKNEDLTLVHGTLDNPEEFNYLSDSDDAWRTFGILQTNLCFIGHTHLPGIFIRDMLDNVFYRQDPSFKLKQGNKYIINVGSVGQPRDGDPRAGFCIFDSGSQTIHLERAAYDIAQARRKIIEAGLPQYLGDRLLSGR